MRRLRKIQVKDRQHKIQNDVKEKTLQQEGNEGIPTLIQLLKYENERPFFYCFKKRFDEKQQSQTKTRL